VYIIILVVLGFVNTSIPLDPRHKYYMFDIFVSQDVINTHAHVLEINSPTCVLHS
jgi:hypothetical protein